MQQHLLVPARRTPEEVVSSLGAIQAQDYRGSLWAIGLRMRHATEQIVEQALASGLIVRTWPMRGTLHIVPAVDVRWMLRLLTPRVIAAHAARLSREFAIDAGVLRRSRTVIGRLLKNQQPATRRALYTSLDAARISTGHGRGLHIVWRLAQEGFMCLGARQGTQPTFVLLDAWVSDTRPLQRDEALAELARRYFRGHGPATLRDFAWWSGLPIADTKRAIDAAGKELASAPIGAETMWWPAAARLSTSRGPIPAHVLPAFDEYTVAYQDRRAVLSAKRARHPDAGGGLGPVIVVEGQVVGTWKRVLTRDAVGVQLRPFAPLTKVARGQLVLAIDRYAAFLERPAAVGLM